VLAAVTAALLVPAVALLAACGGDGGASEQPAAVAEPPSGDAVANFPTGKFIKSGSTDYGLIFTEDGTFSVFSGESTVAEGTYVVDGDVYTETSNNANCEVPKDFTYTFDGAILTFNYVDDPADDPCSGRRADFDNATYTPSP
jgi:hypothetical protein